MPRPGHPAHTQAVHQYHVTLVEDLIRRRCIRTRAVADAFLRVDRGWFVPPATKALLPGQLLYADRPLPLNSSVTISAPHMHAMMAELLYDRVAQMHQRDSAVATTSAKPLRFLDIGSGSGFITVLMAAAAVLTVGGSHLAVGVEHDPQLVEWSQSVLADHAAEFSDLNVRFEVGDGRHWRPSLSATNDRHGDDDDNSDNDTDPTGASDIRFDLIHVGAAAESTPTHLVDLLAPGGRLVVPVAAPHGDHQELRVIDRSLDGRRLSDRRDCDVVFVPLTDLDRQNGNNNR